MDEDRIVTVKIIRGWPLNNGWHVDPMTGNSVKLGEDVTLGDSLIFGNFVTLGNFAKLGKNVKLGNYVKLRDFVTLDDSVTLGNCVILGDGVTLGKNVTLSDYVTLGNFVALGDGETSNELNEKFCATYKEIAEAHIFSKWVTRDRTSPNFDGVTPLKYEVGATLTDAAGMHVLRRGYRPEWCGLCAANHDLMEIHVRVASEDILFAGLPSLDARLRVRKLVVLD